MYDIITSKVGSYPAAKYSLFCCMALVAVVTLVIGAIHSKLEANRSQLRPSHKGVTMGASEKVFGLCNSAAKLRSRHRAKNESANISKSGDPGGVRKRSWRGLGEIL